MATKKTAAPAHRPAASNAILAVSIEFLAVGLFALIAGASDEVGTIMVVFMVGLWLIFMVTDSAIVASIGRGLQNVVSQTQG